MSKDKAPPPRPAMFNLSEDDGYRISEDEVTLRVASFEGVYDDITNKILTRISSLICHNYKNFF